MDADEAEMARWEPDLIVKGAWVNPEVGWWRRWRARRRPYRVDVAYQAQERLPDGWHEVATCWDEEQIPAMLDKARSRFPSALQPDRPGVEIRLVRREIRYTVWPE